MYICDTYFIFLLQTIMKCFVILFVFYFKTVSFLNLVINDIIYV